MINTDISDTIIALVGPTGAGKSTLIDLASGRTEQGAGHTLERQTSKVQAVRVLHPRTNLPVMLVDTPGFDEVEMPDTEVLSQMEGWLKKTYKHKVPLSGIIYLQKINDNRMTGSPLKNLSRFEHLCGGTAAGHVVLVTTMWDRVSDATGEKRENELKNKYWYGMVRLGSTTERFHRTPHSAWKIIDGLKTEGGALLLQEEMANLRMLLSETEAGKTLYSTLQNRVAEQQETIRKLREAAETEKSPRLFEELTRQYNGLRDEIHVTFGQIERLIKVPISTRIKNIFFKKTTGVRFSSSRAI